MPRTATVATFAVVTAIAASVFSNGWHQTAQAVPATDGYRFSETFPDGRPVTFDGCAPITLAVNPAPMPAAARAALRTAATRISDATGIPITVGTSDLEPQPGKFGATVSGQDIPERQVLVVWSSAAKDPQLDGDVLGLGGPIRVGRTEDGSRRTVAGEILLDGDQLTGRARTMGAVEYEAVIMHELGHVLGLDHVSDPYAVMNDHDLGLTRYGLGDQAGLRQIGTHQCR